MSGSGNCVLQFGWTFGSSLTTKVLSLNEIIECDKARQLQGQLQIKTFTQNKLQLLMFQCYKSNLFIYLFMCKGNIKLKHNLMFPLIYFK